MATRVVTAHIPHQLERKLDSLAERLERPREVARRTLSACSWSSQPSSWMSHKIRRRNKAVNRIIASRRPVDESSE